MDGGVIFKAILIGISLAVATLSSLGVLKWRHDNKVEELAEEIVKAETGLDIDLSPDSPEE